MRVLLTSLVLAAAFVMPASAANREAVPVAGTIQFDVFRGDSLFGTHILRFEENGDELRVTTDVELRVRIGPITVFRYKHDAVEVYDNGHLIHIVSTTLKDGEQLSVNIERHGDVFVGRGSDEEGNALAVSISASLTPSSHWAGYVAGLDTIINTETGGEMPVTITELGMAYIEVGGRQMETRHIRLEGSLTLELWYDTNGEWVRSQFVARGQDITYVRRDI
ncbi:MAG: hypothetical protein COW29_03870 [Rhodobacterales bacterium CG15_BIG_FIL_POST_REV_8_21_14_020_59_13]|nr:MAG: hypothetical protein COW29_03870 [Rhodobacterales bacterium CG15_BIG_FIL_POST_REV_8_21_14_020_59_13]